MRADIKRLGVLFVIGGCVLAFAGCKEEGTAEKAGKEVDKAAQDASKEVDKAAEDAGEALEDLTGGG